VTGGLPGHAAVPVRSWLAGRSAPDGARPGHAVVRAFDPVWRTMASPTGRLPLSREVVVTAARALIEDEGLEAVSFRRLAQRLGVTGPALYAYVSDKEDLLRSVTARELLELMNGFQRADGDEPIEVLRRFCHLYIDYAIAHPALYKALFQFPPWEADADRTSFGLPLALSQFAVPYATVVEAMDRGLLRSGHPLMVALALWTAVHGLAEVLLLGIPGEGEPRRQFCQLAIDAAIDGLRPRSAPGGQP
jgi:AcrR family transcriptional regulator